MNTQLEVSKGMLCIPFPSQMHEEAFQVVATSRNLNFEAVLTNQGRVFIARRDRCGWVMDGLFQAPCEANPCSNLAMESPTRGAMSCGGTLIIFWMNKKAVAFCYESKEMPTAIEHLSWDDGVLSVRWVNSLRPVTFTHAWRPWTRNKWVANRWF